VDLEANKILARLSQPFRAEWRGGAARSAGLSLKMPNQPESHSQLSNKPILRIETGMHTANITSMATDAAYRFLVTGSGDGTARVWSLATGELLRVLRPPYAPNFESRILCCAISPNGNRIACGGQRGGGSDYGRGDFKVHIFDRRSGHMVKVIRGLTSRTVEMAFSKDGHYLALETMEELKVYRLPGFAEVASIQQTVLSARKSLDFAADGRIVTSGIDEFVYLYDKTFKLAAKKRAPGGSHPVSAVFSPDGTKIAVGFDDSKKVNVLKALDLGFLYEPDTTGAVNKCFNKIAFSADGKQLIATGPPEEKQKSVPVRFWDEEGRGKYRELQARPKSITQILPLNYNQLAFIAREISEISWGVFDALGERKVFVSAPGGLNIPGPLKLLVSQDGANISVRRPQADDKVIFSFSVRERQFGKESRGLLEPRTSAPSLGISDWKRGTPVVLNGKELTFMTLECKDHLAISPDEKSILVANALGVCVFGPRGRTKWEHPLPNGARGVNISGDGRVAVVVLVDRTIRWYRMSDGEELLALYTESNQDRWVLWTPSGYYACSPGAEDLVGWHINNGEDAAADFYPVSRFRSTFYRPDVVAKVLDTRDEAEALRLADAEANRKKTETVAVEKILPPTITILSPESGETVTSEEIELRYSTGSASPDASVTSVVAMVDGRPLEGGRGVKKVSEAAAGGQTIRVPIPHRDCVVSLHAKNRHGVSEAAYVRLKWGGTAQAIAKPKLYALVVGVSAYEAAELQLGYAAKDAQDFGTVLDKQKGGLYREVEVKLLTDKQAMRDAVLSGLKWLREQTTPNDVAVLFLAGHGVNDTDGSYYFLPANASIQKLSDTGVRFSEIRDTLAKITGKAFFFVDTCHAGNVIGDRRSVEDLTRLMNESSSAENGVVVFASSTGKQWSLEDDRWRNGAFTKVLVEGINGEATVKGSKKITVLSLAAYLSEHVSALTDGKQTPTTTWPKGTFNFMDLPVAMLLDKAGQPPRSGSPPAPAAAKKGKRSGKAARP